MFLEIITDHKSSYWLLFTWYRQSRIIVMMTWATFDMLDHSMSTNPLMTIRTVLKYILVTSSKFLEITINKESTFWLQLTWYSQTKIT